MIKNDLFLKALRGETVDRPPVWMMRQAGRYLPEFMEIKEKYDFFTRCQTPELASEITVQPIRRYGMDAAILFSDILVIPQAMNIHVEMKPDFGPWVPDPIRTPKDLERVIVPDINETLGYVMDAIDMTKEKLNDEVPLIGFRSEEHTSELQSRPHLVCCPLLEASMRPTAIASSCWPRGRGGTRCASACGIALCVSWVCCPTSRLSSSCSSPGMPGCS